MLIPPPPPPPTVTSTMDLCLFCGIEERATQGGVGLSVQSWLCGLGPGVNPVYCIVEYEILLLLLLLLGCGRAIAIAIIHTTRDMGLRDLNPRSLSTRLGLF